MTDQKSSDKDSIKHDEIAQLAEQMMKWRDTYDQFVWLLAELELKLQLGRQPSEDEIRPFAESIAKNHPSIQELHWFLAENTLKFQKKIKK